jgi:inorganic pyrophosphatase
MSLTISAASTAAYVLSHEPIVRPGTASALFVLPVGIGLSRVCLDRHWMSDVAAGWLMGASGIVGMTGTRPRRAPRLSDLEPLHDEARCVLAIIETPKGSRTKLAYDPDREAFVVKKVLPQGLSFPFDFGFIPSTRGDDGDPLDVLVLMDDSVASGSIVPSRLIGVIEALQTEQDGEPQQNDRLIAIADACQLFADVKKLSHLPEPVVTQIEQFFVTYNEQEGKQFEVKGRHGRKRAEACFEEGRRRHRRRSSK